MLLGREVTTTPIEEAAMAASRKECGVEVELMAAVSRTASTAGSETTSRLCGPEYVLLFFSFTPYFLKTLFTSYSSP